MTSRAILTLPAVFVLGLNPSPASAGKIVTLFSFSVDKDGGAPHTDLTLAGGALIGTTTEGGTYNGGTLFSFTLATSAYLPFYNFGKPPRDGSNPSNRVSLQNGIYFGTTYDGGTQNQNGTTFGISAASGKEVFRTILHIPSGIKPDGGLTSDGTYLYGTAADGSTHNAGCVFRLDPSNGEETILYSFKNKTDGGHPYSRLLLAGKRLIGTTQQGGSGAGTIFAIDMVNGTETVLYDFKGGDDGNAPQTGVIANAGVLYGTTQAGGTANHGTVFSLDLATGVKTMLHSFAGAPSDGENPVAMPTLHDNVLYGTTENGGAHAWGTVWSLPLSSTREKIRYNFTGGADGDNPLGQLVFYKNAFYGTTSDGGGAAEGTIFKVQP